MEERNKIPLPGEMIPRPQAREEETKPTMFRILTANEAMEEAAAHPDPVPLYPPLVYEGEIICVYADSNVGKSIYVIQMAVTMAKEHKVLYFDFELSDKQFQLRYTSDNGTLFKFPDNLYRVEIDPDKIDIAATNFEQIVIKQIEDVALQTGATIIIIDNLTWLCNEAEKGEAAGTLMKALLSLKRKHAWTIIVVAHTPKRSLSNPITQNDLAGSKRIFNLIDSAFSIGYSAKDCGLRYIKQTKVRYGEFQYTSENVCVCQIDKVGSFTKFVRVGFATEQEHLRTADKKEDIALKEAAYQLREAGKSIRDIAVRLGVSKSKIQRLLTG